MSSQAFINTGPLDYTSGEKSIRVLANHSSDGHIFMQYSCYRPFSNYKPILQQPGSKLATSVAGLTVGDVQLKLRAVSPESQAGSY